MHFRKHAARNEKNEDMELHYQSVILYHVSATDLFLPLPVLSCSSSCPAHSVVPPLVTPRVFLPASSVRSALVLSCDLPRWAIVDTHTTLFQMLSTRPAVVSLCTSIASHCAVCEALDMSIPCHILYITSNWTHARCYSSDISIRAVGIREISP